MYPGDFYYTKDHEWVRVQGQDAVMGITDFAQKQLGDVVFVQLPEVGANLEAHQSIGTIESVKAVSDVFSPLAGEVTAVNGDLVDNPEIINQDPHGKGWIMRLKPADPKAVERLMKAAEYEKHLEGLDKET
ncbi:MAG: glycine cleavage system protein GcvH [Candidatus Aminicenantes bacterium]|nr:glycine cleavage system protein GcvH [Candidatus Aminicenantes bacterium]